jgi:hypothetical protein
MRIRRICHLSILLLEISVFDAPTKQATYLTAGVGPLRAFLVPGHRNVVDRAERKEIRSKLLVCHRGRLPWPKRAPCDFSRFHICSTKSQSLRMAIGQVTFPDVRLFLTERTFPTLAVRRKFRLLGCWRGQINRRNINLVVRRSAIALPAIYDPFWHT